VFLVSGAGGRCDAGCRGVSADCSVWTMCLCMLRTENVWALCLDSKAPITPLSQAIFYHHTPVHAALVRSQRRDVRRQLYGDSTVLPPFSRRGILHAACVAVSRAARFPIKALVFGPMKLLPRQRTPYEPFPASRLKVASRDAPCPSPHHRARAMPTQGLRPPGAWPTTNLGE